MRHPEVASATAGETGIEWVRGDDAGMADPRVPRATTLIFGRIEPLVPPLATTYELLKMLLMVSLQLTLPRW